MTAKQVRERKSRVNNYPLRHLSVRVPWHYRWWAGTVCAVPQISGACPKLKGISSAKQDEQEVRLHCRSLEDLPRENGACCAKERFEMELFKCYALAAVSKEHHGHFRRTPQRYPFDSVGIEPFRWMMGEKHCCQTTD